jgi:hypothetical protein
MVFKEKIIHGYSTWIVVVTQKEIREEEHIKKSWSSGYGLTYSLFCCHISEKDFELKNVAEPSRAGAKPLLCRCWKDGRRKQCLG